MKTARQLFDTHKRIGEMIHLPLKEYTQFEDVVHILTEHDKEIISKINETIKEYEAEYSFELTGGREGDPSYPAGKISVLTELKEWMEK